MRMRYLLAFAAAISAAGTPARAQQHHGASPVPGADTVQRARMHQMMARMDSIEARARNLSQGMMQHAGSTMPGGSHDGMQAMAAHFEVMAGEMKAMMAQMQSMHMATGMVADSVVPRDMNEMGDDDMAMPAAMEDVMRAMERLQAHMQAQMQTRMKSHMHKRMPDARGGLSDR